MKKRRASAIWLGAIDSGQGTLSTESRTLDGTPYSFKTRFKDDDKGTNPEELLGAAHAGCFAMALSKILGEEGYEPERIEAEATVSLKTGDGGISISGVHLVVKAQVGDADEKAFRKCAEKAKDGCPVSVLFDTEITLDATLVA